METVQAKIVGRRRLPLPLRQSVMTTSRYDLALAGGEVCAARSRACATSFVLLNEPDIKDPRLNARK
jgi:hypothetical protein